MNVLLTGATGFLGTHLLSELKAQFDVSVLGRTPPRHFNGDFIECDLEKITTLDFDLSGFEVVIHTAALVHMMQGAASPSLSSFRKVNTEATLDLARKASNSGVKRFIFISSIKVNGESTLPDKPFSVSNIRLPEDDYGRSKSEAEVELLKLAESTDLEVVIIRPTLVYGPGVKGNFAAMLKLVKKRIPLPFGGIKHNKRSFVSVCNLVDLISTCIDHPNAVNQVFLVSDGKDLSTFEMVRLMERSIGKQGWQVPIPVWCFSLAGKIFGKSDIVNRLVGSLHVDISETQSRLNWTPPQSIEDGFLEAAASISEKVK